MVSFLLLVLKLYFDSFVLLRQFASLLLLKPLIMNLLLTFVDRPDLTACNEVARSRFDRILQLFTSGKKSSKVKRGFVDK